MKLLGTKATSGQVSAALALFLTRLILHWFGWLQYFLQQAIEIMIYNDLKVYPLQSPCITIHALHASPSITICL